MHETGDDLDRLQRLLDDSYARAGQHLRAIHTDAARIDARELVARMEGMKVAVVATVSLSGRPLTGPVDTFLYRGRLHFGTDHAAVRTRHLAHNDAVSATYVEGEGLVVTVHGRAVPVRHGQDSGYGQLLRSWYGGDLDWLGDNPTWAIEPERLFAADMTAHQTAQTEAPP